MTWSNSTKHFILIGNKHQKLLSGMWSETVMLLKSHFFNFDEAKMLCLFLLHLSSVFRKSVFWFSFFFLFFLGKSFSFLFLYWSGAAVIHPNSAVQSLVHNWKQNYWTIPQHTHSGPIIQTQGTCLNSRDKTKHRKPLLEPCWKYWNQ